MKLHQQVSGPVGKLEALEALAVGIQGKLALWKALDVAADSLAGSTSDRSELGCLLNTMR